VSDPVPWHVRSSEWALHEPWYKVRRDVVELPDGTVIDYYRSVRPDVAVVLPLTADGDVVLVRQYKHGVGAVTLEIPGGLIDAGEDPTAAAERELREETGYAAPGPLEPLGWIWGDASKSTERIFSFLARDVERVGEPQLDPNEAVSGIVVERRPWAELGAMVDAGELAAQATVVTVLKALRSVS
jgi:8-oxo-dGTP pyrophosphatase MutT (NUDIX family)